MTLEDLDTLARTIFGEARGEAMQGKIAVAYSVINRVKAKSWYGKTITDVCLKPWQYSCHNQNDPNLAKLHAVTLNDRDLQLCTYAALAAGLGLIPDPTGGATHYHTHSVHPSWAEGKLPVCSIGSHKFYLPQDIDG